MKVIFENQNQFHLWTKIHSIKTYKIKVTMNLQSFFLIVYESTRTDHFLKKTNWNANSQLNKL